MTCWAPVPQAEKTAERKTKAANAAKESVFLFKCFINKYYLLYKNKCQSAFGGAEADENLLRFFKKKTLIFEIKFL